MGEAEERSLGYWGSFRSYFHEYCLLLLFAFSVRWAGAAHGRACNLALHHRHHLYAVVPASHRLTLENHTNSNPLPLSDILRGHEERRNIVPTAFHQGRAPLPCSHPNVVWREDLILFAPNCSIAAACVCVCHFGVAPAQLSSLFLPCLTSSRPLSPLCTGFRRAPGTTSAAKPRPTSPFPACLPV